MLRHIRNSLNPLLNSQTPNLNKTLTPPIKHLQTIQLIHQQIPLQNLPHPLREVPNLRLQHQQISLKQFGQIVSTRP
ncbi:DNA-binding protein WhiA, partial [Staphylococcus epidermidis]|uniref:DNA-binding protein WhiA n=1 Tax=Staphylococcus epidermidis TaxID=1282 RepID=UPI0037DA3037